MYTYNQFSTIIKNIDELKRALQNDERIINGQDELGMTLLHHAASLGSTSNSLFVTSILDELFSQKNINLSIQDNTHNTALHTAAWLSTDVVTFKYILPYLVQKAHQHSFDFSMLGHRHASVLHIAAIISYSEQDVLQSHNLETILSNTSRCNLNTLSGFGKTALADALNLNLPDFFIKSNYLLDMGADPMAGIKGRRPVDLIPKMITCVNTSLKLNPQKDYLLNLIDQLSHKIYTNSLLTVLSSYRKSRDEDSRHYFSAFSVLGGYSKADKLNAVNALISSIQDKYSVNDMVLDICQQGRLGQLISQWENDTGITISAFVNNNSNRLDAAHQTPYLG